MTQFNTTQQQQLHPTVSFVQSLGDCPIKCATLIFATAVQFTVMVIVCLDCTLMSSGFTNFFLMS